MRKNKKKKWTKLRHKIVRNTAFMVLYAYCKLKYRVSIEKFKEQEKRPYLILFNHQTAFDQFFVGMAFKGPVYYVASEDIFSKGFVSSLIRYLVAPIPIKKQTTDVRAVLDCIKVNREGGTIAIAPEGNRTFDGRTVHISPAIAPLARKLGAPIALYRLEGGYGVHPRWSDKIKKGKMRGYVHRVVMPEEYNALTDDELYNLIKDELYVDEGKADARFYNKRNAEYLERVFYYCPYCKLSEFESAGDIVTCKKCGRRIRYTDRKELKGEGFDFPYRFTTQWYDAQEEYMHGLDLSAFESLPMYSAKASLSEVIVYKKKKRIENNVDITLFGNRIEVVRKNSTDVFAFDEVEAVTVLGRNKLNIYKDRRIFQIKSTKRFNALLFVNTYYHHTNISRGTNDGKFLGL